MNKGNEQDVSPALEFRNVSISFDDTKALSDVSFQLARGEMIFLTGVSNSGKSVLLHLAMGLLKPDSGQIFVADREIARALIGWPSIMLFDEPTMGLDPIVAVQVLDLIIRARDINKISSIYVTKKPYEIPYLATYHAAERANGTVEISEAPMDELPRTRVMVLESGEIAFSGNVSEFQKSDSPAIKKMLSLEPHDHSADPHFADPWDKKRRPKDHIL